MLPKTFLVSFTFTSQYSPVVALVTVLYLFAIRRHNRKMDFLRSACIFRGFDVFSFFLHPTKTVSNLNTDLILISVFSSHI